MTGYSCEEVEVARTKKWFFFLALLLICVPSLSLAQSEKDAVAALKNLETRVEGGLTYSDYVSALDEAAFRVKAYLDGPDAGGNPELASTLSSVLRHYEAAREVWSVKYAGPGVTDLMTDGYYRTSFSRCLYEYGSAPASSRKFFSDETTYSIGIFDCLPRIWEKASEDLFIASDILTRMEKVRAEKAGEFARLDTIAAANFEKKVAEMEATKKEIETIKADNEKLKEENSVLKQESERLKKENEALKAKLAAPPKKRNKKKKQ